MLKGKALDILRTLSKDEYKKFEAFADSPYFNTNKSIVRLLTELKRYHPEFTSEAMTENLIYEKVFGRNKFSYSALRNIMSELLGLCETFLVNERLNNKIFSNVNNVILLLEEFQLKNLDSLFDIRLKKLTNELKKEKIDVHYFANHLAVIDFNLDYLYNKIDFKKKLSDAFQDKASYKLLEILNGVYRNGNSIFFSSQDYDYLPQDNIFFKLLMCVDFKKYLEIIKDSKDKKLFIIEIYVKLTILVAHPEDEKNFFQVKKLIFDNINKFSNIEKYSLLNTLRNYAQMKTQHGVREFMNEGHELQLMMLDSLNFKKDKLDSVLGVIFLGLLFASLGKKDYAFTEEMINKYSVQLRKEIRKDVYGFSMALLNFEKKEYEKALQYLAPVKIFNNIYFARIKELYLKIYYELNYYEEAFSLIDSYKHFLSNKEKFNDSRRTYYLKISKITYRLLKIKSNPEKYSEYDVVRIEEDIHKTIKGSEAKWLLSKTTELKKIITN